MINKITITFATAILLVVGAVYFVNASKAEVSASNDFFHELNVYRKQLGLREIYENTKLDSSSQNKVAEMFQTGNFAHVLPTDKYPKQNSYSYLGLGELLAYNFQSENSVLIGWKNSPTHNDLLVKAGYCEGGFFTETRTVNGNQDSYQVLYLGTPVGGCDPVYAAHANDSVNIVPPSTSSIQSTATAVPVSVSSVSTPSATSSETIVQQVLNVASSSISTATLTTVATIQPVKSTSTSVASVSAAAATSAFTGEMKPIALVTSISSSKTSSQTVISKSSSSISSFASISSATTSLPVGSTTDNIKNNANYNDVIYARLKTLLANLFLNNPKLFWKIINAKM